MIRIISGKLKNYTRDLFVLSLVSVSLTACATAPTVPVTQYKPAVDLSASTATKKLDPPAVMSAASKVELAHMKKQWQQTKHTHPLTGLRAINSANRKATVQPNSNEYMDAIMTFNYQPGALFQVYCAPLSVTDLQFQQGERVISVAAGDTLRWEVSRTYSGNGGSRIEHILIKPTESGLTNSLVITTDKRTYHLKLHATDHTYMASVQWRYPESDNFVQHYRNASAKQSLPDVTSQLDLNKLDFHYHFAMLQGKTPSWKPTMVFNDGHKTYIQFPANMQIAPALFVGNDNNIGVVNYRVEGNFYVVDSVFDRAQLRAGQQDQTVLEIIHDES